MSLTNAAETALLNLLFNNQDWANIGDATGLRGSSAAGVFHVSLHTGAGPGETGNQTTLEAAYTNYARVSVSRSGGFSVSGNVGDNAAAVTFASASSSGEIITYAAIGTASTGSGNLIAFAPLTSPYTVTNGDQPEIPIGDLDWTAA